jgi:hypothetical protein
MNSVDTRAPRVRRNRLPELRSTWPALAFIWGCAVLLGVLAPDLVSGSEQEHLPLAMFTVWLWATAATAFAAMVPRHGNLFSWTAGVAVVWVVAALAAVLAPDMVTGSDPTSIPIAALVAPPVAAVVTGLLSLQEADRQLDDVLTSERDRR